MRVRFIKRTIVAFLGGILIVASFATNNFGISQAYIGTSAPTITDVEGFNIIIFCFGLISPQVPYELPSWPATASSELIPNATAIILVAIAAFIVALVLAWTSLIPSNEKRAVPAQQSTESLQPTGQANFKKHKYSSVPELKRHRSYHAHST